MIGLSDTPPSRLVDSPSWASLLHRTRPFCLSFLDTRPLPHPHVLYTLSLSLPSPASYTHPPCPALSRLIHTLTLALLSHIVHTPALSRALASYTHSHSRSTLSHHLYTLSLSLLSPTSYTHPPSPALSRPTRTRRHLRDFPPSRFLLVTLLLLRLLLLLVCQTLQR